MAEPITLTAAAVWFLSSKAADWFIGGPTGNFSADAVKALYKKSRLIWEEGKVPENEDLIKALQTAQQKAAAEMLTTLCNYLAPIDAREAQLVGLAADRWLKDERNFLNTFAYLHEDETLYRHTEYLLAGPGTESMLQKRDAIVSLVKSEFWKQLNYGLGKYGCADNVHVEQFLFKGWKIGDKSFDWFELVVLYFGSIIKDDSNAVSKRAWTAFQGRMLSDIKVGQQAMEAVLNDFSQQLAVYSALQDSVHTQLIQIQPSLERLARFVAPQPHLSFDYSGYTFVNQTLFKARSTTLLGRGREMEELLTFSLLKSKINWWVITGDLGSGKSRLAMELCFKLPANMLKGFILTEELLEFNWHSWEPEIPTLIIIDDASAFGDKIISVLKILYHREPQLQHPVKFLFMDRNTNGEWWDTFNKNINAENIPAPWQPPLLLTGLIKDHIWSIFSSVFRKAGKPLPDQHLAMKLFYEIDPQRRPLFALFAAQSLAAGEDIRGWNKARLLESELDRQEVNVWKPACGGNPELLRKFKLLAALSTVCAGLDKRAIKTLLDHQFDWLPDKKELAYKSDIYKGFGLIENHGGSIVFKPMEPDTLGEYFVLRELNKEKTGLFDECVTELMHLAWAINPARTSFTIDCSFWDFKDFDFASILLVAPPADADKEWTFNWLKTISSITSLCAQNKWFDKAEQLIEQIIRIAERGISNSHFYLSKAAAELCSFYFAAHEPDKALKYFRICHSICEKQEADCYEHYAKIFVNLSILASNDGNVPEAVRAHQMLAQFNEEYVKAEVIRQINKMYAVARKYAEVAAWPLPAEFIEDLPGDSIQPLAELLVLLNAKARNAGLMIGSMKLSVTESELRSEIEPLLKPNLLIFPILEGEAAHGVIRSMGKHKQFAEAAPYIAAIESLSILDSPACKGLLAQAYGSLTGYLAVSNQVDEAETYYQKLAAITDSSILKTIESKVTALQHLVLAAARAGDFKKCDIYLLECKQIPVAAGSFVIQQYALSLNDVIKAAGQADDDIRAQRYLRELQDISEVLLPGKPIFIATGLMDLFFSYNAAGKPEQAEDCRNRLRDLRKFSGEIVAAQHTRVLYQTMLNALQQGDTKTAISLYNEAKPDQKVLTEENLNLQCSMAVKLLDTFERAGQPDLAHHYYLDIRNMAAIGNKRALENLITAAGNLSLPLNNYSQVDLLLTYYNDVHKYAPIINTDAAWIKQADMAFSLCHIYAYSRKFDESEPVIADLQELGSQGRPEIFIRLVKAQWTLFTQAYGIDDRRWESYLNSALYAAYFIRSDEKSKATLDHMRPHLNMMGIDLDQHFVAIQDYHKSQRNVATP